MAIKYLPYKNDPLRGQAILPLLHYNRQLVARDFTLRGLPLFETEVIEEVNHPEKDNENMIIHGDCLNACAYLKERGIQVDLVYIDPPFASGANYAKKIYLRKNPKLLENIESLKESELDNKDLQVLEETMYGDIWQKEDYLNWLYERLIAIKEVMSPVASIYVHLDWHIGHYVKLLMDEIFGEENFRNEVVWSYRSGGASQKEGLAKKHDMIFRYTASTEFIFNSQKERQYLDKPFMDSKVDTEGRYYVDTILRDVIEGVVRIVRGTEIVEYNTRPVLNLSSEQADYATQKPIGLIKLLLEIASKKDSVVADFFGGSGVVSKAAVELGNPFITCDVGVNAIQTIRDGLIERKASFKILKIKDGIDIFRNPQQTMDKLGSIIPGLTKIHNFGDFWFGALVEMDTVSPCWVPNLLDRSEAILNPSLFLKILDEVAKLNNVSTVAIFSVETVEVKELERMIKERDLRDSNGNQINFLFKDLKNLTDVLVHPDYVEFSVENKNSKFTLTVDKFVSDLLYQKVQEFNAKKQRVRKSEITISENGLELIEYVSIDVTNADGVLWTSDTEIKMDKDGFVIVNGTKKKEFWDGKITTTKKPLRLKVRSIAGDETIVKI